MAISFVGSVATEPLNISNNKIAFIMENSAFSKVAVNILRLVAQMENIDFITGAGGYMPMLRTRKVTGVSSGGVVLNKAKFDSAQISDAGVIIRSRLFGAIPANEPAVTGNPETAWQQFTSRRTTLVEQQQTWDSSLLPALVGTSPYWTLYPGECLVVYMLQGSATGTVSAGGIFFIQAVWQEDNSFDAGYTISGDVTLDSVPVEGAKVFVLTDLSVDMTDPKVEVKTTNAYGQWSKDLASGVKAAAFVQHKAGADKYTDEGKPYLEKP